MSGVILDLMSEKDLDAVVCIENASFTHPWSRSAFLSELSNEYSHNLVLKLENSPETYQIIAYMCYRVAGDDAHILKIAVHPEYRRKGIAFEFLTHCLALMPTRRVRSAILEVRQFNLAGIGLYKKSGFAIEAQLPKYYSDTREDVILMRKNFLKEE